MSDTAAPRRIRAQGSPSDPDTMRFILDAPIKAGRAASFDAPDPDAPLSVALFALAGVRKVQVTGETILVSKSLTADWQSLKPQVATAIRWVLDSASEPLGAAPEMDADAALLTRVRDLLDQRANPSIASHGGRIDVEGVEDGTVYLRMSGGCQGCAASAATLRNGVETMLRAALPAIREIVDVTDHATGTNPFYTDEAGKSPSLTRPVPADVIGWEDGKLAIDPDFLAPRLGLDPARLQAGLSRGDVVITSEPGRGPQGDRTRVVVRGPSRAWAAEVLPDGSAREVPPPRLAEPPRSPLAERIRHHLEGLPPERLPITYGQLARGLGMYLPGSVRKVTGALEFTMREDMVTDRPFIAARVVGRGADRMPGRGFFDLARSLGRGPAPQETEAEFYRRLLAESLGSG